MSRILIKTGNISLYALAPHESWKVDLDQDRDPWVREALAKIGKGQKILRLNLELRRDGDRLIVEGELECHYQEECVRCLELFGEEFGDNIRLCFVPAHERGKFQDGDSLIVEGREAELHFHERGRADLKEALMEQLFMRVNPFPLHRPDCQGLCPTCGINLNITQCTHQAK